MQVQEIKSQMQGLEESEKARQNALLAQLVQLRAIDHKVQTNNEVLILLILVDTFSTRAFNTQAICFKEE